MVGLRCSSPKRLKDSCTFIAGYLDVVHGDEASGGAIAGVDAMDPQTFSVCGRRSKRKRIGVPLAAS